MHPLFQQLQETTNFLTNKGYVGATVGVVLGTGLGKFTEHLQIQRQIAYSDIPHFAQATVEFHKGQLILGNIGNIKILAMQGRFHYYEGYSMQQITFPIRVMQRLGVQHLLLSNAAGGINLNFKKGNLVLLNDHINLQPESPLRGLNTPEFGNRFVDLSAPYNGYLNQQLTNQANKLNIHLPTGVYASVMGPNLETRAEYRYLRSIGADMVGMSTVPEVIVANQVGLPCAAISVITDECDPDNLKPVDISEIIAVAGKADAILSQLLVNTIETL